MDNSLETGWQMVRRYNLQYRSAVGGWEGDKRMNLNLVYIELAEIRDALDDRRLKKFHELTKRSSMSPYDLMEVQKRWWPDDLKLGESNVADRFSRITGIEGSMVICTSVLNKLRDLEEGLQELLGQRETRKEIPETT